MIYVACLRLLLNWLKSRPCALFLCSSPDSAKEQLCADGAGGEGTKLGHWAAMPAHKSGHQCPAFSNQVDPNFMALSPLTLPLEKSTRPLQAICPARKFLNKDGTGIQARGILCLFTPLAGSD